MNQNRSSSVVVASAFHGLFRFTSWRGVLAACLLALPFWATSGWGATSEAGLGDAAKEVADSTSREVEAAGEAMRDLWRRIDEARLKNRTRDELVAWVIIGILVGAVAGMLTPLKSTGAGKFGRLLLGLVGSFLGGVVAHVAQFNFGWGPVLIRYEELFFALIGAILIVLVGRVLNAKASKPKKGEGK